MHRATRLQILTFAHLLGLGALCFAHSGRTDANGGHHVRATGGYHYHHGNHAHQHENGICTLSGSLSSSNGGKSGPHISNGTIGLLILLGLGIIAGGGYFWYDAQKFRKERESFRSLFEGKDVRDIAEVPSEVKFDVKNLPYIEDGSDHQWGTLYTVYLSKTGGCFHRKKGCSRSLNAVHLFLVQNHYSKCSRCCDQISGIPKWFLEYSRLLKIKEKYKL